MVNGDDKSAEEVLNIDARCYTNKELLIDNVNKVLQHIYRFPGFAVYIYDIMNKFKGRPKFIFG